MRLSTITFLTLTIGSFQAKAQRPEACRSLNDLQKQDLVKYVHARYRLRGQSPLSLGGDTLVPGTCFHLLTFDGESSLKKWQLKLYLSPDARYLTSDLFDTTVDPVKEERDKTAALMAGLSQNKGSSVGPDNAPVTIVVFSDFQCPYCRKFDGILREVLSTEPGGLRVVFHHMPLSMHPWARIAAESAACAQLQSSRAFWDMQGRIFHDQPGITLDNVKAELGQIAQAVPSLDQAAFQTCMDNDMSLGLVFRDIELASSKGVSGTPTIFINGHRDRGGARRPSAQRVDFRS